MSYLIWQDEKGVETDRKVKGRGRVPRYFKRADDGNWYYDNVAARNDVKPVIVKPPKQSKQQVYLITLDADGNETERIEKKRGRIPGKYLQRPDGNWYRSPDFMKPASSASAESEDEDEDEDEDTKEVATPVRIPKLIRIHARNKTTSAQIMNACNILNILQDTGITVLDRPVRFGKTGIPELDQVPGHPIFYKIEIDENANTVSVWGIASPGGPYLIIEDVLENNNGDNDAATPERN